jgi:hypothetical protein
MKLIWPTGNACSHVMSLGIGALIIGYGPRWSAEVIATSQHKRVITSRPWNSVCMYGEFHVKW